MPKINILEKQVAELIAAGEVVERPSSIVKELMENAVDAKASSITVEIQGGGVRYIRVSDNGSGIERADVRSAFLRHATSKVRQVEDLNDIATMGFRGEALASIAAMCRVEMLTRTREEQAGTHYRIAGGEEEELEDAGCPVGTTITVRDVFYNTPARMKFLKKDISEGNSVAAVVEKIALGNPEIHMKFIRDGVVRLQTPGDGKLISAVRCVLGREFSENVIPVDYSVGGLHLEGVITTPSFSRSSRTLQNFFINHRFVRSRTCMAALEESYRNAMMVGKFPSCVLNLQIPPQVVDVNVHPAKLEVRFTAEKEIFDLVYYGCKTALGAHRLAPELKAEELHYNPFAAHLNPKPPVQQRLNVQEYRREMEILAQQERSQEKGGTYWNPKSAAQTSGIHLESISSQEHPVALPSISRQLDILPKEHGFSTPHLESSSPMELLYQEKSSSIVADQQVSQPIESAAFSISHAPQSTTPEGAHSSASVATEVDPYENTRIIGELFETYILLEKENELLLVDKHAAHERLLFNKLKSHGIGEERQMLLQPIPVQLSKEEHAVLVENLDLLEQAGITAEDFGGVDLLIRGSAPILAKADLSAIVVELAEKLLRGGGQGLPEQIEEIYHTIACRSAIKAHDSTPIPSLQELIEMLRTDGDAQHCPHGRPICIRMSKYEIEKKFGRLG